MRLTNKPKFVHTLCSAFVLQNLDSLTVHDTMLNTLLHTSFKLINLLQKHVCLSQTFKFKQIEFHLSHFVCIQM